MYVFWSIYVCVYLCMYKGYIYVDLRPSFSCQNILSPNACIDPGRPATYIHMQSCDVEAEPLTQYLRPLSLAAAPNPIQRKRAIPRYRIRKAEYRIQQSKASAGDVSLILRQSSGDVSRINRAASPQMRHSGSKLGQTMSIVTCPPCPAHFDYQTE